MKVEQAQRGRRAPAIAVVLVLVAVLTAPTSRAVAASSTTGGGSLPAAAKAPKVSQEAIDAVAGDGEAFVIASLSAPANAPQAVASTAQAVLDGLPEGSYQAEAKAQPLPFVALKVDAAGLAGLSSDPAVTKVDINHRNVQTLVNSVPAVGGDVARSSGYDGTGTAVAVLDIGVQANHPFLSDGAGHSRVVSEGCFSGMGNVYGNVYSLCPSGDPTQTGPGSAAPCAVSDSSACGHGTHVAGIAAGGLATNNGTSQPKYGMAPKASILAANVFSLYCAELPDPDGTCPDVDGWQLSAFDSDIALALNWVDTQRSTYDVAAVNLSVGSITTYPSGCGASGALSLAISTLRANGVATVAASGNGGSKTGISSPACLSDVISVGSWDDGSNTVSTFSNSSGDLKLLAPGAHNASGIVSSYPTSTYAPLLGTSMAAPHVAGAIALLHQAVPTASVWDLENRLRSTGSPVMDSNNIAVPRMRLDLALPGPPTGTVGSVSGAPYPGSTLDVAANLTGFPAPAVSYQWYRCPSATNGSGALPVGCTPLSGQTNNAYTVVLADIGSYLTVRVQGSNGFAPAFVYSRSSALIPNTPPQPAAPTAVAGLGTVDLFWLPFNWAAGLPVTGFRVTMTPVSPAGSPVILDVDASTTNHQFTGLALGATYSFTVMQRNVNGFGPSSDPSVATPFSLPSAPTNVVAAPGDGSATVTFSAPVSDGGNGINGYVVTASPGGKTCGSFPAIRSCTVTGLTNGTSYTFTVKAQNDGGLGPASGSSNAVTPVPGYHSLVPARIMDTRSGSEGGRTVDSLALSEGRLAAGETRLLEVTGRGGVPPSGVSAVALNVTVAGSTGGGYLTVFESGVPAPLASNLNFYPGQVVPNMVIAKVGADGKVAIKNVGGATHLVVDVVGWFATGSPFTPIVPTRYLETRSPTLGGAGTFDGVSAATGAVASGATVTVPIADRGPIPAGAAAVALNVTVADSTGGGYVTVYPSGVAAPVASNLNFYPHQVVPNMVITKIGADGNIVLKNVGGATHLIVDVVGWFASVPGGLTPLVPARLMDTRPAGQGGATVDGLFLNQGPLADGENRSMVVAGRGGVPAHGVSAVVLNVTVAGSTGGGYLTVFDTGVPPLASNLNFYPGQVVPNMVIAKVTDDGQIRFLNVGGSTPLVVDVVGWFPA